MICQPEIDQKYISMYPMPCGIWPDFLMQKQMGFFLLLGMLLHAAYTGNLKVISPVKSSERGLAHESYLSLPYSFME